MEKTTKPLPSPLPLDLSSWCSTQELVRLVLESVQNTPLRGSTHLELFQGFQPRMLLTLLTYCYATGVYSSQEIEIEIGRNSTVRYLCARSMPDWNVIREFRRVQKEAITASLVQVFSGAFNLDGTEKNQPMESATLQFLIQEAQRRVSRAIFLDSVSMDD